MERTLELSCALGDQLTSPLSVCFFSHSSQLTGAERSLLELVTQLIRAHGVHCSVVLPSKGPLEQKLKRAGASSLILNYPWWCDEDLPAAEEIDGRLDYGLKGLFQIREKLARVDPDVIFTNTMVIPWGAIAASLLGKPHVWFIHEFGELDHGLKFYLPFQRTLEIIKDSSNLIFVNCNTVREALFGKTSDKNIVTVYYDIEIAPETLQQEDGRHHFSAANATKLIITGRVTDSKGQKEAVLAVKELVQRKKDVELLIVGATPSGYLSQLEKIVIDGHLETHVRFHEFNENPYPAVNEADIVLVCSRHEAFARVIIEAMLLRKPVIGTNTGGTPELIKDGWNGLLYQSGDHRQLADKIEYLIDHQQKINELGENGFKFARKTFTRGGYGKRVYALLKDLQSARNPVSLNYFDFARERISTPQADTENQQQLQEPEVVDLRSGSEAQKQQVALTGQVTQLTIERERMNQEIAELQATVQGQQGKLKQNEEQLAQLRKEQQRSVRELVRLESTVKTQQQSLGQQGNQIAWLTAERTLLEAQMCALQETLRQKEGSIDDLTGERDQIVHEVRRLRRVLSYKEADIRELRRGTEAFQQLFEMEKTAKNKLDFELSEIGSSLAWHWVRKYRCLKDWWFPSGTERRKVYNVILSWIKEPPRRTALAAKSVGPVAGSHFSWGVLFNLVRLLPPTRNKGLLFRKIFFYLRYFGLRKTCAKIVDWADRRNNLVPGRTAQLSTIEVEEIILPAPRFTQGSTVRPVDIIIPVYNQGALVRQCIESVLNCRCASYNQIFVVDDASNEKTLVEYLKSLDNLPDIRVIHNQENLGFAKSTNVAMKQSSNDVLLLNSDTVVTEDWLSKIQQAAYIRDDIATVSPLSNNASICSIPECCEANAIPDGFTTDSFAEAVERISLRIYPEVPSTVGFCMYIKRKTLSKVGYFNEEVFKKGYGEENDLCMRLAAQGYKHIIDDSTFVYHFGSASFPKEKQMILLSAGVDLVGRLHPTYLGMVENYFRHNPLSPYYRYLRSYLKVRSVSKPIVLIVVHAPLHSVGGVELQTGDLIRGIADYCIAVMEGTARKINVQIFCEGERILQITFNLDGRDGDRGHGEVFKYLLTAFDIKVVHFQHLQGWPSSLPSIAKRSGAKTILSLHDFYLFCESYNLLNHRNEFCDYERDDLVCSDCLHRKGFIDKRDSNYQRNRRERTEKMMRDDADVIVTPSDFVKRQFCELFPNVPTEKYRVFENGT